ncbi:MAG: TonB-dependent receptor [Bacteroidota bacterium]
MFRKWGILAFALLLAPVAAWAQTGKLSGTVVDRTTNEPLPGATVVIEGTQLGAAADANGEYFIIGVPAGTYSIIASFIGYEPTRFEQVSVNAGFTRTLDVALSPDTELLDEVVVTYERPIIQKDAIGVPKVVSGEELQNLPVRGVGDVAALQGGVVSDEGSDALNIRGGRDEEVVFFVDGVKVIGQVAVPQAAIQEQSMLIGSIPAKYGDATAGIISVTTKSGNNNFFGSLEGITSEVLDAFGYNLGSFSVGGPIIQDRAQFFISGEFTSQDDRRPSAQPTARLSDSALDRLTANPQALRITNTESGEVRYVTLPGDIADGTPVADVVAQLNIPDGFELDSFIPVEGAEVEPLSSYEFDTAKRDNDQQDLALNGNITFNLTDDIRVRAGARYGQQERRVYSNLRSLFNSERNRQRDENTLGFFGGWTHYLSNSTFYQVQVDYTDTERITYDPAFSDDVRDVIFYGDLSNPANAVASRYKNFRPATGADGDTVDTYINRFVDGSLPNIRGVYSVFAAPGTGRNTFTQFARQQFRVSASATTQIGLHQIEFGGEYEQRTQRLYQIFGGRGGSLSLAELDIDRYEDVTYGQIKDNIEYYGYNFLGTTETDDQDIDAFVSGENRNLAPYEPIYYAGYIQDKIEYRDLILNLGVRIDVFDNNSLVLRDRFALVPIVRANEVANRPGNIESDFAVYYDNAGTGTNVVGYRDLDGNFFDANGQESTGGDITRLGAPQATSGNLTASVFEDYEPQVTIMPRVGVSFPVTDQALFFASYDVTSQRPFENSYDGIHEYFLATEGTQRVNNTGLEPVQTTEYELGFKQRLGERAAVTLSGFYKRLDNLIALEVINEGFPNGYTFYGNNDFGTVKGATFEFELRRTANVAIDANYTLQFAEGTGSDANTATQIAWRGNFFPNFISPLDFDRRHSINISLDYRLGEGEGPMIGGAALFENFGINLVTNLRSGKPFTRLQGPNPLFNSFILPPAGGVNDDNLPWSSLVNLRIDRAFSLGDNLNLTAFLWIQNLLDTDTIVNVYQATGLAETDGWLVSGEGQDFVNNQESPLLASELYGFAADSPFNYGIPRLTRLGLRVNF